MSTPAWLTNLRRGGGGSAPSLPPRLLTSIPIVTGNLSDGDKVGSWRYVSQSLTTGLNIVPHKLGRVPNGYIPLRLPAGGSLTDPFDGSAHWTASTIILDAGIAGIYGFFVL